MDIRSRLLPYAGLLETRSLDEIDLVVVHCTELPDLDTAREYGERVRYPESGTGNSGHFYIDRDGSTELWVPENRVAHHVRGFNLRSVGIELVNNGRYPHWYDSRRQAMAEPYAEHQIDALLGLIAYLAKRLSALRFIAGHEDLDTSSVAASDDEGASVRRKRDPGEFFPWPQVLATCGLERYRPEHDPETGE